MKQIIQQLLSCLILSVVFCTTAWAADVEWDVKSSGNYSYSGTNNVTLKNRVFTANEWTSICLPFDASKTVLDATFGEGNYNIQEYDSYEGNVISFKKVTAIKAATPYFIRVTTTKENPVFNGVTFSNTNSGWKDVTINDNIIFRGYYYCIYAYNLVGGSDKPNAYVIRPDGSLGSYKTWGEITYVGDNQRYGTEAFLFAPNSSSSTKPSLIFEGVTDDNGGGSTSGMTLEQKIENKAQLTNVPTLYITVPDAEGKAINTVLDEKKEYHTATIQLVDKTEGGLTEFTDQVMIKVRGNSTAKENKKPYRLKFAKEIKDANGTVIANCQKHDMLGKGYSKRNWALLANYLDPAMVRNALTNKIGELVGMPFCPGYKFADVVINGEYRGTYQITDHVEADADRVNVDENTGWFLESARGDMVEAPSASAQSLMMSIKNPDTDKWTTEQIATLKTQIEDWFKPVDALFCIYNGTFDLESFTDPVNGWRKYWDEETLVNFYIGINLTGDYDGFMTVKMYRDLNKKLKFGPLWDKDLAFGNYSADKGTTLAEDQQTGDYFSSYVKKLWLDPVFVKKVHDKLNTLVSNGIVTTLKNNVDELAELTAQTEELNRPLWGIGASWSQSFSTREAAIQQLKDYLDQHIPWFQSTINTRYNYLGGDNIVDNSIPGDDFNDGTTPGDGGGSGNVDIPETSTFEKLNVTDTGYKIPASAFNAKATSIEVTFTRTNGTATNVWGFYGYEGSEWNANGIQGSNWNTYKINITNAEDIATVAKNGIAWRLQNDGGTTGDVTIVVHNIGVPEGGDETDTPTPAVRAQLTNLPTIYLDADNINGEWLQAAVEVYDKDNMLYQGTEWKKEGVSKKGNINVAVQYQGSGADNSKNSYRLKFNDKINLLSATGLYKQWVLLANDDDPTMLNNALAKELGDAIGMPWTPGYQFVDLYVNGTYMGTYQLTDRVKAEEGRSLVSDGNKDADWQLRFNDDTELQEDGTTDYISGSGVNVIYRNPDPKDITAEALGNLKSDLGTYFNSFFAETATNTFGNIPANVDQQQLINWYIAQEILGVYKGFSSIEAYRSVTEGAADNLLHFGPLWDSEKGFGNTGEAPAINMGDLNTSGSHKGLMIEYSAFQKMNKIFNYLWTLDWFKSGVKTKWDAIKTTLPTSLAQTITTVSGTIAQSQALNAQKWNNSLGSYSSYDDALTATNTYITNRFAYLDKKFNELAGAAHVHSYTAYIDNGDGTHSRKCTDDDEVEEGSELHTLKVNAEGKAACSVCHLEIEGTSNMGNTDEKVYILDAETSKVQYISKSTGFTPAANTLYKINEQPEEGTSFDNVYWTVGSDNYADNIIVTDGTAWLGEVKVSAKNATYSRAMGASSIWGTVCLPFKTQPNDDVILYALGDSKTDGNGNGTMTFKEATSTGGNTPLVFKKKNSDATNVTFSCGLQETGYVTVKAADGITKNTSKEVPSGWTFLGNVKATKTYTTSAEANPAYYYISKNKFWQATGTLNIAPFRAYFQYSYPVGTQAPTFTPVEDDSATEIESTYDEQKILAVFSSTGGATLVAPRDMTVSIYTSAGALVKTVAAKAHESQFVTLPSGMYVINGAKFTVK